ncbi:MAG: Ig-like domain repeat protein [Oscillospiraceae bacterium]|nr:Ig-like domain repeat protein [Oscillospiraceae bacterium]
MLKTKSKKYMRRVVSWLVTLAMIAGNFTYFAGLAAFVLHGDDLDGRRPVVVSAFPGGTRTDGHVFFESGSASPRGDLTDNKYDPDYLFFEYQIDLNWSSSITDSDETVLATINNSTNGAAYFRDTTFDGDRDNRYAPNWDYFKQAQGPLVKGINRISIPMTNLMDGTLGGEKDAIDWSDLDKFLLTYYVGDHYTTGVTFIFSGIRVVYYTDEEEGDGSDATMAPIADWIGSTPLVRTNVGTWEWGERTRLFGNGDATTIDSSKIFWNIEFDHKVTKDGQELTQAEYDAITGQKLRLHMGFRDGDSPEKRYTLHSFGNDLYNVGKNTISIPLEQIIKTQWTNVNANIPHVPIIFNGTSTTDYTRETTTGDNQNRVFNWGNIRETRFQVQNLTPDAETLLTLYRNGVFYIADEGKAALRELVKTAETMIDPDYADGVALSALATAWDLLAADLPYQIDVDAAYATLSDIIDNFNTTVITVDDFVGGKNLSASFDFRPGTTISSQGGNIQFFNWVVDRYAPNGDRTNKVGGTGNAGNKDLYPDRSKLFYEIEFDLGVTNPLAIASGAYNNFTGDTPPANYAANAEDRKYLTTQEFQAIPNFNIIRWYMEANRLEPDTGGRDIAFDLNRGGTMPIVIGKNSLSMPIQSAIDRDVWTGNMFDPRLPMTVNGQTDTNSWSYWNNGAPGNDDNGNRRYNWNSLSLFRVEIFANRDDAYTGDRNHFMRGRIVDFAVTRLGLYYYDVNGKDELRNMVETAESVMQGGVSTAYWLEFKLALHTAKTLLGAVNPSHDDVDAAMEALETAMNDIDSPSTVQLEWGRIAGDGTGGTPPTNIAEDKMSFTHRVPGSNVGGSLYMGVDNGNGEGTSFDATGYKYVYVDIIKKNRVPTEGISEGFNGLHLQHNNAGIPLPEATINSSNYAGTDPKTALSWQAELGSKKPNAALVRFTVPEDKATDLRFRFDLEGGMGGNNAEAHANEENQTIRIGGLWLSNDPNFGAAEDHVMELYRAGGDNAGNFTDLGNGAFSITAGGGGHWFRDRNSNIHQTNDTNWFEISRYKYLYLDVERMAQFHRMVLTADNGARGFNIRPNDNNPSNIQGFGPGTSGVIRLDLSHWRFEFGRNHDMTIFRQLGFVVDGWSDGPLTISGARLSNQDYTYSSTFEEPTITNFVVGDNFAVDGSMTLTSKTMAQITTTLPYPSWEYVSNLNPNIKIFRLNYTNSFPAGHTGINENGIRMNYHNAVIGGNYDWSTGIPANNGDWGSFNRNFPFRFADQAAADAFALQLNKAYNPNFDDLEVANIVNYSFTEITNANDWNSVEWDRMFNIYNAHDITRPRSFNRTLFEQETGLVFTRGVNDNSPAWDVYFANLFDGVRIAPTTQTIPILPEMASGYDMNKLGEQTVTISYKGQSFTYDIFVGGPDLSLDKSSGSWDLVYGYDNADGLDVTVSNTGTLKLDDIEVTIDKDDAFELNLDNLKDLDPEEDFTFTVAPKDGLAAGTYTATVTVTVGDIEKTVTLTINVDKANGAAVKEPYLLEATDTAIKVRLEFDGTANDEQIIESAISTSDSLDDIIGDWNTTGEFSGLSEYTEYYVFARSKESANYLEGTAVMRDRAIRTQDVTAPYGDILVKDRSILATLISKLTFGYFFRDETTVTITGGDAHSGLAAIEYFLSDTYYDLDKEEDYLEILGVDWVTGWTASSGSPNNGVKVDKTPQWKGWIYAQFRDSAGNDKIIMSGALVIFEDNADEVDGGIFIKNLLEDFVVDVESNGNTILSISFDTGSGIVGLTEDDYSYSDDKITFKSDFLRTLPASNDPYAFFVQWNPMGEKYVGSEINDDAPGRTDVKITVSKAEQEALGLSGLSVNKVAYGTDPIAIEATGGGGETNTFEITTDAIITLDNNDNVASYDSATGLLSFLGTGTFNIVVNQDGDDVYNDANEFVYSVTVDQGIPSIRLAAERSLTDINDKDVILTATVSGAGSTPTGTVSFFSKEHTGTGDYALIGDAVDLADGVAECIVTAPDGLWDYMAVYSGDSNYADKNANGDPISDAIHGFDVSSADQTIAFGTDSIELPYGVAPLGLFYTEGDENGDGEVTLSLSSGSPTGVIELYQDQDDDEWLAKVLGVGQVVVVAEKAATPGFNAATDEITITITPRDLNFEFEDEYEVSVEFDKTYSYTGERIMPEIADITVTDAETNAVITENDYDITAYGANINAGKGSITLTAKGNYEGTRVVEFDIAKAKATAIDFPTVDPMVYSPTRTLGDIPLVGGKIVFLLSLDPVTNTDANAYGDFAWSNPDAVPNAAIHSLPVWFAPNDFADGNVDFSEIQFWNNGISKGVKLTITQAEGAKITNINDLQANVTHNKIELTNVNALLSDNENAGFEFAISDKADETAQDLESLWDTKTVFDVENVDEKATNFYIYVRSAESGNYFAGEHNVKMFTTLDDPANKIELDQTGECDFGTRKYGYDYSWATAVKITNLGNQETGDLTVAIKDTTKDGANFAGNAFIVLDGNTIPSIDIDGNATFAVNHAVLLEPGVYTATVVVSNDLVDPVSFTVKFTVTLADGAAVSAPELVSKTANSITVKSEALVNPGEQEIIYSISKSANPGEVFDTNTTGVFTGLDNYTDYWFFAMTASKGFYDEGMPSANPTAIRTNDGVAPTGWISVAERPAFETFINTITFGIFFKNTASVTVKGEDADSGVKTIEYILHGDSFDTVQDAIDGIDNAWTVGYTATAIEEDEAQAVFNITAAQKGSVYARITDQQGNYIVINSDGIVVYNDSEDEVDGGIYTIRVTGTQRDHIVPIEMNDNTVAAIVDEDGKELVAGTDYTVDYANETITFSGAYLAPLGNEDEEVIAIFTVTWLPMGETPTTPLAELGTTTVAFLIVKAKAPMKGNPTDDGEISVSDVLYTRDFIFRRSAINAPDIDPDTYAMIFAAMDMNEDGVIDIFDLIRIRDAIVRGR